MANLETVAPMIVAMKARQDMTALACETLHKMFQKDYPELVEQVSNTVRLCLRLVYVA